MNKKKKGAFRRFIALAAELMAVEHICAAEREGNPVNPLVWPAYWLLWEKSDPEKYDDTIF